MLENQSMERVSFELGLEFGADFADILSREGPRLRARRSAARASRCPIPLPARFEAEHNQFVFEDPDDSLCTQILLSQRGARMAPA